MEGVDTGLLQWLFNQGLGVAIAVLILGALVYVVRYFVKELQTQRDQHERAVREERERFTKSLDELHARYQQEKSDLLTRYKDLLSDRKVDRDHDMRLKERIATLLESIARYEPVVRLAEAEYELGPKRRAIDRAIAQALDAQRHRDSADDDPRDRVEDR